MSTPLPRLSVVCPAYQEEEVLPRFHAALGPVLDALAADYEVEVVYVDDGSADGTLGVLRQLAAADRRVRYLSLSRNFGHQAALTAGLEHATGEVVVSMDSDLQHPPALVPALLERWKQGFDVVLTERIDSSDLTWFKRTTSRGFYWLLSRISEIEAHPAASDFRLLSRPALDALLSLARVAPLPARHGQLGRLPHDQGALPGRPARRRPVELHAAAHGPPRLGRHRLLLDPAPAPAPLPRRGFDGPRPALRRGAACSPRSCRAACPSGPSTCSSR